MNRSRIEICGWCLNEFISEGQSQDISRKMRSNLFIADDGFEPVICERCFVGIGTAIVKAPSYALVA